LQSRETKDVGRLTKREKTVSASMIDCKKKRDSIVLSCFSIYVSIHAKPIQRWDANNCHFYNNFEHEDII
jgi:hypothetical protein